MKDWSTHWSTQLSQFVLIVIIISLIAVMTGNQLGLANSDIIG